MKGISIQKDRNGFTTRSGPANEVNKLLTASLYMKVLRPKVFVVVNIKSVPIPVGQAQQDTLINRFVHSDSSRYLLTYAYQFVPSFSVP